MSKLTLLDDQPAEKDSLHFQRYVDALDKTVFARDATAPLVVGVFGAWGSGKSTLLGMLERHLTADKVGCLENYLRARRLADFPSSKWVVVKFSPWLYRNEKSLLLPLLATLAKQQPAFDKLVRQIVKSGPSLIKKLTGTLIDPTTTGLSLLALLDSVLKDKAKAKDLQEKIKEAVKAVTGTERKLVFLIDDLDRCHDPKQIVNLLEQIKLFLHLDSCLFFIAADRMQIVRAIDSQFSGAGESYLEKFVQIPLYIMPHQSNHLLDALDIDAEDRKSVRAVCEVFENNPRKIKQLVNEAKLRINVLEAEMLNEEKLRINVPISSNIEKPEFNMMLKWLLLKDRGELVSNPFKYIKLERNGTRQEFMQILGFQNGQDQQNSPLAMYLWNDLGNKFGNSNVLALYTHAAYQANARKLIQEASFAGGEHAIFQNEYFRHADLSDGHYCGVSFQDSCNLIETNFRDSDSSSTKFSNSELRYATFRNALLVNSQFTYCDLDSSDFTSAKLTKVNFINCNLEGADFSHADLSEAKFINCQLAGACFDEAKISQTTWKGCKGLHELDTEPQTYTQLIDIAGNNWRDFKRDFGEVEPTFQWDDKENLFKAYKTILTKHQANGTLTDELRTHLVDKGKAIKQALGM